MLIEHKGRWSEDFSEVTLELRNKANMVDGAEKLSWAAKRLKTMGFSIVTHKFYTDDYYIDGLDFITLKVD